MNSALQRYKRQKRCKKKFESEDEDTDIIVEDEEVPTAQSLKLKIKIGMHSDSKGSAKGTNPEPVDEKSKVKRKKKEGDSSSEEERWLDAIESGNLHEVDEELRHIQGRKGMTARQRSLLERKAEKLSGRVRPKEKRATPAEEISEEMKHKKALKTQKRREQAHQKREKDKKQTLDKLLKKQDVKQTKTSKAKVASAAASKNKAVPMISYRISLDGVTLSYPVNIPFPIVKQIACEPPPKILCEVSGCRNPKKYSCSKTGVNLCSLACYKRNLEIAAT